MAPWPPLHVERCHRLVDTHSLSRFRHWCVAVTAIGVNIGRAMQDCIVESNLAGRRYRFSLVLSVAYLPARSGFFRHSVYGSRSDKVPDQATNCGFYR